MINNKFIFYRTYSAFENDKTEGKIPEESIVFIKDKQLIYTHDTMFQRLSVDSISLGYFPTESKLTEQFPNGFQSKRAVAFIGANSPYDIYVYDGKVWINSGCKLNAIKGDDGPTGPRGPKGDTGLQGPKGDNGKSAYEVAVDEGFAGDEQEWLDSLIGPKGDKGEKGDPGNISNIVLVEDHSGHGDDYTKYYVSSADSDKDLYTRINSEVDRATEQERIFGETLHWVMSIIPTDAITSGKMLATQEFAIGAAGEATVPVQLAVEAVDKKVDDVNTALGERIGTTQLQITSESNRAQSAESALDTKIEDEITRSTTVDDSHSEGIKAINEKIPAEASKDNQLADKEFVNSSISTATADFKGTYNLINDLKLPITASKTDIQNKLLTKISTADINDYCFVQIPTSAETPDEVAIIQRYKHTADKWVYEYDLNNSGYTAEQWAAINSNMTAELTTKLTNLPTNAQLGLTISDINSSIATKLDKISDLQTIREGAAAGATAVQPEALNDYYKKEQVDTKLSELDIPVVTANGGNGVLVKDKHNISNGGHSVALGSWGDSSGGHSLTTGFATQALGVGSTATGFLTTANGKGSFSGGEGDALLNVTRLGEKSYQSDDILVSDLGRYITRNLNINKLAKVTSVINKTFTTDVELSEDAEFTAHICRTVADGESSFAFGEHVITDGDNQVALGKYNLPHSTSLLMVGNGFSDDDRLNALELTRGGDLHITGTLSISGHPNVGNEIKSIKNVIPNEASSENKLADKAYVDTKVGSVGSAIETVDQAVDDVDRTLAQHIANTDIHLSEKQKSDIANIGDMSDTLDLIKKAVPSAASEENPLTDKKYVDDELAKKQNKLTFDTIPTDGSTNPVESNGVYDAIKVVKDDVGNIKDVIPSKASKLNKLTDKEYVDGELGKKQNSLEFDSTPTKDSLNPVTSGGVWSEINRLDTFNLETSSDILNIKNVIPSDASGINRLVTKEELDTKQNTLTFDTTPTKNSENPVTSDALCTILDDHWEHIENAESIATGILSHMPSGLEAGETLVGGQEYGQTIANINLELSGKQDTLYFDTTPTAGSDRPVTSNGIREAIDSAKPNLEYDDLPTKNSEKLVKSGRIYVALGNRQKLTFDSKPTDKSTNLVESGAIYSDIEEIRLKIPTQASSSNQLADKNYVDTNISTASATFRGTYHEKDDLGLSNDATHKQIADALKTVATPADLNDYCFVQIPEHATSPNIIRVERYKYANGAWAYEYDLNNSGFTGAQWAAINSGVTETNYAKHDHTHKVKINNLIKEITKTGSEDVVNLGNYLTAVPLATITALGGFKIGYLENDKNYAVKLDEYNRAYVNVPWTDTNTTYEVFSATLAGLVPAASDANKLDAETAVGNHYLCADGKFRKLPANAFLNTTYSFVDANATLEWGVKKKVATVGGTDINVTMPAKPTLDDVADGSIRKLANYLPLTGGTLNGPLNVITSNDANNPFTIQCNGSKHITMSFNNSDGNIGKVGYLDGSIKMLGVHKGGKAIGLNVSGLPAYYNGNSTCTIWHSGNDGTGSGLDADKLDGHDSTDFARATDVNTLQGYFKYGVAKDADKVDGFHALYTDFLYSYADYSFLSTSAITGDFWYAKIVLERGYDSSKSAIVLKSSYSNISGVVYLNLLSYDDGFNAYVTNYNGCNIVGIRTSFENNRSVIYLKLKKPVDSSDSGLIFYYGGYNATITVSATNLLTSGLTYVTLEPGKPYRVVANTLATPRTIWGQSFDGSANITGRMYSVTGIGNWMNFDNYYGSIGIGGPSPDDYHVLKFHRSVNRPCMIFNDTRTTAGFQKIEFLRNGTDMGGIHWFHDKYSNYNFLLNCINFDAKEGCVTFGTWDNPTFFIDEAVHSVGVDMSSPQHKVDVNGDIHASDGIISDTYVTALATSTTSDKRLKDIKENLDLPIETFAEAPAVKFEWKNNKELGMQAGTIAQYWEEKLKEVVHEGEDGNLSMQYDVAALLGTITIAKKVVEQEDRIKKLEELIELIKNKLS